MQIPSWTLLVALVAAGTILSVLAAKFKPRDRSLSQPWPLEAKPTVLTAAEQVLYRRLVTSLPEYIVLAQVQLLQVLKFKGGARSQATLNRISQLSLDFLIVNPDTSVVAAIELDDSTHAREARKAADARKGHALKSAGIPLIRWAAARPPNEDAIRTAIDGAARERRERG
jgi:very-short-patch-repair endonuclease